MRHVIALEVAALAAKFLLPLAEGVTDGVRLLPALLDRVGDVLLGLEALLTKHHATLTEALLLLAQ